MISTSRSHRGPAPDPVDPDSRAAAATTAASTHTAPRRSKDSGGPGSGTASSTRSGATDGHQAGHRPPPLAIHTSGRDADPEDPGAGRGRPRPPPGGASDPSRTTSSRDHRTRTGRPWRSARRRASAGHRRSGASRRTPRRCRRARPVAGPDGTTRRPARRRPAPRRWSGGSGPRRRTAPPAGGARARLVLRPCTLPAWARASASDSATAYPPLPSGTATRASDGLPSSANPASPSTTAGPTRWGTPPSRVARAEAASRSRSSPAPVADDGPRTRPAASTMVCHPVQRQRWARSAWSILSSGTGAVSDAPEPDGRRAGSRAASRITIPGVQKPHWLPPVATNASDHRSLVPAGSPSSVVTWRPARRRTGVTHATRGAPSTQTVQHPHWPWGLHPSLTERRPSCSRRTSSSDDPSSATSTSVPSTRSRISGSATQRLS